MTVGVWYDVRFLFVNLVHKFKERKYPEIERTRKGTQYIGTSRSPSILLKVNIRYLFVSSYTECINCLDKRVYYLYSKDPTNSFRGRDKKKDGKKIKKGEETKSKRVKT